MCIILGESLDRDDSASPASTLPRRLMERMYLVCDKHNCF